MTSKEPPPGVVGTDWPVSAPKAKAGLNIYDKLSFSVFVTIFGLTYTSLCHYLSYQVSHCCHYLSLLSLIVAVITNRQRLQIVKPNFFLREIKLLSSYADFFNSLFFGLVIIQNGFQPGNKHLTICLKTILNKNQKCCFVGSLRHFKMNLAFKT